MITKYEGMIQLEELFHEILRTYTEKVVEEDINDFNYAMRVGFKSAMDIYRNFTLRTKDVQ